MKKQLRLFFVIMILCFGGLATVHGAANKSSELKLKINEIASLQQSLSRLIALAIEKKDQMEQKSRELEKEVLHEKEQFKIDSYQNAVLNPRIDYNLKLIQLLHGYIAGLADKIRYFKTGQDTLAFFFRQAQDDLLMIKTLNDLEIDKLIAQINEVLDKYIPETGKPLFDVTEVPLKKTEKIWDEIIKMN